MKNKTFKERSFRKHSDLIDWVNQEKDNIEIVSIQHETRQNQFETWDICTLYYWKVWIED